MSVRHRAEKALHVAEKLRGTGSVEARDLSLYKVGLITENIERSGLTNIHAVKKMRLSVMRM